MFGCAHAHQPGGRSVPSTFYLEGSPLLFPFSLRSLARSSLRSLLANVPAGGSGSLKPTTRSFEPTKLVLHHFPMSRREFDRFLPYPDYRRCPEAQKYTYLGHALCILLSTW